jgi:hypothetical protein
VTERRQFHGQVVHASAEDGVTLVDTDGGEHWLPLDPEAYEPAEPGEIRAALDRQSRAAPDLAHEMDREPSEAALKAPTESAAGVFPIDVGIV